LNLHTPEAAGQQGRRIVFSSAAMLKPWQTAVFFVVWWVLLKWLGNTTDPDSRDSLALAGAFVLGLVGLAFFPSWSEIVINGDDGTVRERLMWFRWGITTASRVGDFEAVQVQRCSQTEHEVTGAPGTTFSTVRSRTTNSFELKLMRPRPFHAVDLVLPRDASIEVIEALALVAAQCGGWPAWRQGYTIDQADSEVRWQRVSLDERSPLSAHDPR